MRPGSEFDPHRRPHAGFTHLHRAHAPQWSVNRCVAACGPTLAFSTILADVINRLIGLSNLLLAPEEYCYLEELRRIALAESMHDAAKDASIALSVVLDYIEAQNAAPPDVTIH